jgi:alpha-beta hydrolase superfamily lysophospholipase
MNQAVPSPAAGAKPPAQRLGVRYRFADPDMDLFFVAALGWGAAGGLDVGQAFHVASTITDGDGESWVKSFEAYGELMDAQADAWRRRGWRQAAGEMRLKAFASYRSAWQFASPGARFESLYARHRAAFAAAMNELALPATFFEVPYAGKTLPGVFYRHADADAPVVLVIGGSDTCLEDLFLTVGRSLLGRGFSVALVDLPGQGRQQAEGMHWEVEAERPIAAVVDTLVERFGARAGRIALLGLSLGGYFVTRAAGHEKRFAAVVASTPFPRPGEMFAAGARAQQAAGAAPEPGSAALRNRHILMWKAGASTPQELLDRTARMVADPSLVTVPFLSIMGGGESPIFRAQTEQWHASIRSTRKDLVCLDAATGADGHCQVNNRLRLAQEVAGWLGEVFAA